MRREKCPTSHFSSSILFMFFFFSKTSSLLKSFRQFSPIVVDSLPLFSTLLSNSALFTFLCNRSTQISVEKFRKKRYYILANALNKLLNATEIIMIRESKETSSLIVLGHFIKNSIWIYFM